MRARWASSNAISRSSASASATSTEGDQAVAAYIVWVMVGVIALVLALLVNSTALTVVVGGVIAIAILWKLLARSQR